VHVGAVFAYDARMTSHTSSHLTIDPASDLDSRAMYFLLTSIVVPRPIAWVSTVDETGRANLAPHSFFTVASSQPPTVMFVSIGDKDTVKNVRATKSFVVNIAGRDLAEQINVTSINSPHGVSEFALAGLTELPSDSVAAPRLAQAPVSLECELSQIVETGSEPSFAIFGRITRVHLARDIMDERGRVDPGKLDAVARMGASDYCTTRDRFQMTRPVWAE